jgi:chromosome segregation ATPase
MPKRARAMEPFEPSTDAAFLQHQLDEARNTIRGLQRQIRSFQERHAEMQRAYHLTVENLTEITRQNTLLERECELLRSRAGRAEPIRVGTNGLHLTSEEISAIRKAMARLHHPDTGGDSERMKIWNTMLDALEER